MHLVPALSEQDPLTGWSLAGRNPTQPVTVHGHFVRSDHHHRCVWSCPPGGEPLGIVAVLGESVVS